MSDLSDKVVIVAGAGVFGRATALELQRAGARVTLIDPDFNDDTASAIAAGMLAPAFEAALDPAAQGAFALLAAARDLWPAFVEGLAPTGLDPCGALAVGEGAARLTERLKAAGAQVRSLDGQIFTPDDWRIDPRRALPAILAGFTALGGAVLAARVTAADARSVTLDDGQRLNADAVVLACGYGGLGLAPELSWLTPIKGQVLRFESALFRHGPILRAEGAYLAPGETGPVVGASMQPGVSDRLEDPAVTLGLATAAAAFARDLKNAKAAAFVGVRPSTPDGLPMIGRSSTGVWLAAGARRNGWLLAPLAAQLIRSGVSGNEDDPRFRPVRFT